MAFDRSNPANLLALKNEVNDDPNLMGYNINGPTQSILNLLNIESNNTEPSDFTRDVADLKVSDIANIIDPVEFAGLNEYQKEWVISLINKPSDESAIEFKSYFLSLFTNGSDTRNAAIALLDVAQSRSDQLFGYRTILTAKDWQAARDS